MAETRQRSVCTCPSSVPVYRAYHEPEWPAASDYDKQRWAADVIADPARAAVEMSGMSSADLAKIREAFDG